MTTKLLRAARDRVTKAKATAAEAWQAVETSKAALEAADVPADGAISSMAEFKAAKEAKEAYDTACADVDAAEADFNDVAATFEESDRTFEAPAVISRRGDGAEGTAGFASLGEFAQAVANGRTSELAARGVEFIHTEQSSGTGSEGGYAIPTQFSQQLLELPGSQQIVRPRATVIPAGGAPDAEIDIPSLDQTGAGNMFGGVAVTWQDEELDSEGGETDANLKQVKLQSKGVTAWITVTNKLMRNAAWLTPIFNRLMAAALINSEDFAFLSSNAVGKPTGVRYSDGMKYINRGTANTVVFEDVTGMIAALHPDSVDRAVFIANVSLRPALMGLKNQAGTLVYTNGDPSKGMPDMLYGVPVIYTGKVGAKGAKGDLLLVDFSYYLIKDGAQLTLSASEHVKFLKNRTVLKVNRSVDGKGWVTGPMYLEDGSTTVAPYVGLDVPTG